MCLVPIQVMWRSREMLHVCQRPTRLPEKLPERMLRMPSKRRKQYEHNACRIVLETGDTVLVQNVSEWGGPGKLRSYWEKFMKFLLSLGNEWARLPCIRSAILEQRKECYTATYCYLAHTYKWIRLMYDPGIKTMSGSKIRMLHHGTANTSIERHV